MITRTKAIIGGTAVGLSLFGIAAIPALAHNHDLAQPLSVANQQDSSETTIAQSENVPSQMNSPMKGSMEQLELMAKRCNAMMNTMMKGGNMPEMMEGRNGKTMMEQ